MASPKEKPELPKDAKALAKGLDPEPEDLYARALQATAKGRLQDAQALFVKADQQSQTREHAEETRRLQALTQQQEAEVAKQAERNKRYDLYLTRARMETYDGQFTEVFTWYQKTTDLRPPATSDLINEIGVAGLRAGKYPEAEPYLQQALQQREQDLDTKPPDIGTSLNNLAGLYQAQGKYAEAEPLYQRSFIILIRRLGPDHPHVAIVFGNYEDFLKTSGQAHDEETVIRKLHQRSKQLTPNRPQHPHLVPDTLKEEVCHPSVSHFDLY